MIAMPVTEKEYFEALRNADQRAIELLAKANASRVSATLLGGSILVSVVSVVVAIAALIWKR